jgi:ABC-type polysaccharide/polyol phosphate transport system ATPase subunit
MTSIGLSAVNVSFPIYSASGRSLKTQLLRQVGGKLAIDKGDRVVVEALRDITLEIGARERVGLIGPNGAGKSTLLKILGGILEPSDGRVAIRGRVTALLDMSMGLDPEATGYENIIMRSVFLGAKMKEAYRKIPEIEAFSGLGQYLGFPMRTYSSGMVARLSFAISTAIEAEILILDEHIGAADAEFTAKAHARLGELVNRAGILVFASHDLGALREVCTRGIVLAHGRIVEDAPIAHAIEVYEQLSGSTAGASR